MHYIQINMCGEIFYVTKKFNISIQLEKTFPRDTKCLLSKSFNEKCVFDNEVECENTLNWIRQFLTCEGSIVQISHNTSPLDKMIA
jgi:hypothetical protein